MFDEQERKFVFYVCVLHTGETVPHSSRSLDAPSNLVTSEVTARSFRVSWTHAAGQVEKYRVVYYATKGSRPEEVQYASLCVSYRILLDHDRWTFLSHLYFHLIFAYCTLIQLNSPKHTVFSDCHT